MLSVNYIKENLEFVIKCMLQRAGINPSSVGVIKMDKVEIDFSKEDGLSHHKDNPDALITRSKNEILETIRKIVELDEQRKKLITQMQELQADANKASSLVGKLMRGTYNEDKAMSFFNSFKDELYLYCEKHDITCIPPNLPNEGIMIALGPITDSLKYHTVKINRDIEKLKPQVEGVENELKHLLHGIPNILDERVRFGLSEKDNEVIKVVGTKPTFDFPPKEHNELGVSLQMMHFETAVKIAGSRFSILSDELARLSRALTQFMMDIHTMEHNFIEVDFPHLANRNTMFGTGQFPKFEEDIFCLHNSDLVLIPTGEAPMTNLVAGCTLSGEILPIRFVGHSQCYRKEAGSAGKDTKGMLRQHQFGKVELVSICKAEQSDDEHNYILSCAEKILQLLGLHYRVVRLCSKDVGFSAKMTYDIEVWLPGQNSYREISSCSNTGSFQASRMEAHFKDGQKREFLHTLNGSGLAVGRALIAVLENYQNNDGTITVPPILKKYLGKMEMIGSSFAGKLNFLS